MSYELLSEPIRRYIRDKRWEQLRPIQNAAISRILTTNSNYILASRTASGKTEAAFLPILSKVDFKTSGIQVLYISPLIALINDQFYRIEELCKYLDVRVTKWHGEANRSSKEALIKKPEGIVLITPESLEAMFVHKPHNIKHFFANLKFVVVDEIHSFIGTDRGIQLKSILSRIHEATQNSFRMVGLSATIGDYNEAKKFFDEENTKVLIDRTAKDIEVSFKYFKNDNQELSIDLLRDLFVEVKDNKVLLFPNSRGKAEEFAVKLKRLAEKNSGHLNYFSHHSSVDKEVREYVEHFAKSSRRENFCISCTSTLELGIDIGTVDEVVQIDATHSISSLIQRVGRSGRKEGLASKLFLYATNEWSLLQSMACWTLYCEGFIEPPRNREKPYDILLHQALSIVKGRSGIARQNLIRVLRSNNAFKEIEEIEMGEIIDHLIETDFLELVEKELIIGVDGERIVNNREFYSVFKTEDNFKIIHAGTTIGEIPFSTQLREDENILLAAKIWKIKYVDFNAKKVEVIRANDGKAPKFGGDAGDLNPRIRERMLELLYSKADFDFLDATGKLAFLELRKEFSCYLIEDYKNDRPLRKTNGHLEFYSFTGSRINRSIQFLFEAATIKSDLFEAHSYFSIEESLIDFQNKLMRIESFKYDVDSLLEENIEKKPGIIGFSKWGEYLPIKYQLKILKDRYFDFTAALEVLRSFRLVVNSNP